MDPDPTFDYACGLVLGVEGVLSNDAYDPGGETKYGHAQNTWSGALARMPTPIRKTMPEQVRDLSKDLARAAYFYAYWRAYACQSLPPPLAVLYFDAKVNGGRPTQWTQRAVGVKDDGLMGNATRDAANEAFKKPDQGRAVLAEFQAQHLAYLTSLDTWRRFGAVDARPLGWSRRLFILLLGALNAPSNPDKPDTSASPATV
jgi:lysozyme family protein